MKKLSLLALLLAFCMSAICAPVSIQMAQRVAEAYWGKMSGLKASFAASQTEFSEFYVFNNQNGGGFVLVSADDIAHPILGYSLEGTFRTDLENLPNVRTWFKGISKEISTSVAAGVPQSAEIATEWDEILNGTMQPKRATRAVNALLSTTWDQGKPYNNMCPADANDHYYGGRTVTGCVATAMAQVMKYWNYPAQGNGSHSYSSSYGTLSANFGATTYDWNNMLNSYSYNGNSETSAQKTAVATLMYHCGVAVEMGYDIAENGGSGAYSISYNGYFQYCAETALVQFFKYKSTIEGYLRANYQNNNETAWKNKIKSDLDAGRPIIYSGAGDEGGHCFVCDGYNTNDRYHFNWGWSGDNDGFYALNALAPGSGGAGGGGYDFSEDQDAIFGIQPQGMMVNPTSLNFISAGESKTFTVTSNTASNTSWNATLSSGASSWLTVTPTTGSGNGATTTVTVTASANTTESQRTATITITQGTETATVSVSQSRANSENETCTVLHEDRFTSGGTVFSVQDGGYVCGSNSYGDQAKAEHFELSGEYNITSVDYAYAVDGTDGNVTFKIWADNNGTPGNVLASQQVSLSTLYSAATNNSGTMMGQYTWTLSSPITVTGNFFAGLDVSNATSYFGLASTNRGGGYRDSYEQYNGSWADMYTNWNSLDISMYILPTVCQPNSSSHNLSVNPTSLSYIAAGESKTITVTSNTTWTASSSASWLTINPTSGSNNGTITAVASANTGSSQRTATITVSGNGVSSQTISVTQAANSTTYSLTVNPTSLSYTANGESKTVTVTSNTTWTASSSANWLTINPANGSNNGTITAVAAANTSTNQRTATITVSGNGVSSQTISVTQAGANNGGDDDDCVVLHEDRFTGDITVYSPSGDAEGYVCGSNSYGDQAKAELFEISGNYNITSVEYAYAIDGTNGSVTFKIWANNNGTPGNVLASQTVSLSTLYASATSNSGLMLGQYSWTLSSPVATSTSFFAGIDVSSTTSYIGLISTEQGGGYRDSYEQYNGSWADMYTNWQGLDISMYILPTVCPTGAVNYNLSVNPTSLSYTAAGESKTVTVTSNTSWTVSSSASWLTISPASGNNNGTFTAVAAANTSTTQRTATITVSGNGATTQTISVTQVGNTSYSLTVNPTSLSYTANGESKTVTVTSNTTWTASSSANWLTISPASGSNNGTITAVAAANTSTQPRSATITVTGANVPAKTITVTQAGAPTSIEEETVAGISVYPNPTNGSFTINFSAIEGNATYQLINAKGAMIETREINASDNAQMSFDYNIAAGVYFVRIISNGNTWTERIIVE